MSSTPEDDIAQQLNQSEPSPVDAIDNENDDVEMDDNPAKNTDVNDNDNEAEDDNENDNADSLEDDPDTDAEQAEKDGDADPPAHRFDDDIENETEREQAETISAKLTSQNAKNTLKKSDTSNSTDEPNKNEKLQTEQNRDSQHTRNNDDDNDGENEEDKHDDEGDDGDEEEEEDDDGDESTVRETNDASSFIRNFLLTPSSSSRIVTTCISDLVTNGSGVLSSLLSLIVTMGRGIPVDVMNMDINMNDSAGRNSNNNEAMSHTTTLITQDMVVANEPSKTVEEVCAILNVGRGRVASLGKDPQSRRLRKGFEDLWRRLAAQAGDAILFDTDCFETIISWLGAMTAANSRGLRASACLAAYRMMDGFISYGARLRKQLAGMQRQFQLEKTKCGISEHDMDNNNNTNASSSSGMTRRSSAGGGGKKALSVKGRELKRKVEDLAANESELTELCDKVFRCVFIIKFRDVAPEIRSMSINALGSWIMSFPQHFLDDSHNKYIGWLLSDKDASVRKASLEVLHSILRKKDFFASLELLLQRFSGRVVEMSRDKDDGVAVSAIQLLTCLLPYKMLERDQCEAICSITVYEPHVELRRAAGEFFAHLIKLETAGGSGMTNATGAATIPPSTTMGGAAAGSKKKRKGTSRPRGAAAGGNRTTRGNGASGTILPDDHIQVPSVQVSREHIKQLLFFVADHDEEAMGFAVDAVWDHLPALQCWEAFDDLLIERPPPPPPVPPTPPTTSGRRRGRSASSSKVNNSSRASNALSTQSQSHSVNATTAVSEEADPLDERDKAAVCEMLLLSAREASGHGDQVRASELRETVLQNGEVPSMAFSRHMIIQLPKLVTQFQSDARAMKALVKLPALFALESMEQEGRVDHLKILLDKLIDALTRHTGHANVAISCADTFRALLDDKNPLKDSTMTSLQLALTEASNALAVAVRSDLVDSEPQTVSAALLRVRVLGELVEPSASVLHEPIVKLLRRHLEKIDDDNNDSNATGEDLEDDALRDAVGVASNLCFWGLLKIRSRVESMRSSGLSVQTLLNTEDMKIVQQRGAEVVDILSRMCATREIEARSKVVCLPGFLTTLTFCRGIERTAVEMMLSKDEEDEKEEEEKKGREEGSDKDKEDEHEKEDIDRQKKMEDSLDLFDIKVRRDILAEAVSKCAMAIVRHEQATMKKRGHKRPMNRRRQGNRSRSSTQSNANLPISAVDLKDCFAALVQASMQSAISKEICHLPLLGLVLKGHRTSNEFSEAEVLAEASTLDLCRQYYERRILQRVSNGDMADEELRAVVDADICDSPIDFDKQNNDQEQSQSKVRTKVSGLGKDVAEGMILVRRGVQERSTAATNMISSLAKWASEKDDVDDNDMVADQVVQLALLRVAVLCDVGTGLLGILREDGATRAKQTVESVERLLEQDWIADEASVEASKLEGFVKALEVIADGRGGKPGRKRNLALEFEDDDVVRSADNPVDQDAMITGTDTVTGTADVTTNTTGTNGTTKSARSGLSSASKGRQRRKNSIPSTPSRKSTRERKQVNYAILEDGDDEGKEEKEEDEKEEKVDGEDDGDAEGDEMDVDSGAGKDTDDEKDNEVKSKDRDDSEDGDADFEPKQGAESKEVPTTLTRPGTRRKGGSSSEGSTVKKRKGSVDQDADSDHDEGEKADKDKDNDEEEDEEEEVNRKVKGSEKNATSRRKGSKATSKSVETSSRKTRTTSSRGSTTTRSESQQNGAAAPEGKGRENGEDENDSGNGANGSTNGREEEADEQYHEGAIEKGKKKGTESQQQDGQRVAARRGRKRKSAEIVNNVGEEQNNRVNTAAAAASNGGEESIVTNKTNGTTSSVRRSKRRRNNTYSNTNSSSSATMNANGGDADVNMDKDGNDNEDDEDDDNDKQEESNVNGNGVQVTDDKSIKSTGKTVEQSTKRTRSRLKRSAVSSPGATPAEDEDNEDDDSENESVATNGTKQDDDDSIMGKTKTKTKTKKAGVLRRRKRNW